MSRLTVVTPATSNDLTTLAAVKQRLNIKNGDEDDNLRALISIASDVIATELNRVLGQEAVTEEFHSNPQGYGAEGRDHFMSVFAQWGYQTLTLTRRPVVTVTSVLDESGSILDTSLYSVYTDTAFVRVSNSRTRTFVFDPLWPHGKLTVNYTAGYASVSDVPLSLQHACVQQVMHYRSAASRDPFLKSRDVPGVLRNEYWVGSVGEKGSLTPEVLDLITKFRDVAV